MMTVMRDPCVYVFCVRACNDAGAGARKNLKKRERDGGGETRLSDIHGDLHHPPTNPRRRRGQATALAALLIRSYPRTHDTPPCPSTHERDPAGERGREGGKEGEGERERERETSHTHTRLLSLALSHPLHLTPLPSSPSSGCPPEHARTAPGMSSGWKMMKRMRRPSQTQRRCDTRCCASFPPWCCSCS